MGAIILAGAVAAVAPFFLEEQARPLADDLLVELPARPFSFAKSNQETKADQGPVLTESSDETSLAASADAEESNIPPVSEPVAPARATTSTPVAAPTTPVKASTAPTTQTAPTTPVKAQTALPSSATSKASTPAAVPAPAATPVAAPTTTPTARQLMVQVGAYATAEAANRVKSRLEAGGNRVVVETTTNAEGLTRFRVRIGPFETREEAVEVRDRAKAQGYDAALVRS
jgi:DedD protein